MSDPAEIIQNNAAFQTPLADLCGAAMETGRFLKLACGIAEALDRLHAGRCIHRHISPGIIMLNPGDDTVELAGRLHLPATGDDDAGAIFAEMLPYISPEQTGRVNRLVDSRSDLYSLGVVLYELLVGATPFKAGDALEWAHCHIARQPKPPVECLPDIPDVISMLVMRLLEKSPDERYQSAAGLLHDLRQCLACLESDGSIAPFPIAEHDVSERLLIPQRLYGRERDCSALLKLLERTIAGEGPLLLMVKGYSGIGKSSLVRELYGPVLNAGGRFLSGKFDQYKRDVPYATIAEAFREPVRQLLAEGADDLEAWRVRLLEAVGINGQLIIDMIPEVELIAGTQPAVQNLPPSDALQRFNTVFQQFAGLFADRGRPLVLFLDDLQWVDPASLRLIEHLSTVRGIPGLLVAGAYRDNEVEPSHPLMLSMERMVKHGASLTTIEPAPLSFEDLSCFMADIFDWDEQELAPLTGLILTKTAGNPFFVIQFLLTLHEDGMVCFDRESGRWRWDAAGIIAREYTDNVVELMAARISRLTPAARQVLQCAACIGSRFDRKSLTVVSELSHETIRQALGEALQSGILQHTAADSYSFLHDRVQQAAYLLTPESGRRALHLNIGRLMLGQLQDGEAGEQLFDVVNQFNQGMALIADAAERRTVARLNLMAGRRARASTAYGSACVYLTTGVSLFSEEDWETEYDLLFSLHRELAEIEHLHGLYPQSQQRLQALINRTPSPLEKARLHNTLIVQHTLTGLYAEAIAIGRDALRLLDIHIPSENLKEELDAALARYRELVGDRVISSLADEPEMTDPAMRVALELLSNMVVPARYSDSTLFALVSITNVNITLQYGPTEKSTVGYTAFGMVLNAVMNAFRDAYEFGLVGLKLGERFNAMAQKCQTSFMIGHYLNQWVRHLKWADEILDEGIRNGLASGEMQWTGYSMAYKPFQPYYRGERLDLVLREIPNLLHFTRKTGNQWATDTLVAVQLALDGLRRGPQDAVDGELPARADFIAACREGKSFGALGRYEVLQAQVHYLFGRLDEALRAVSRAREHSGFFSSSISVAALNVYHSLILLALCDEASGEERSELLAEVELNQKQLQVWVASCPENFRHLQFLVAAELARVTGDVLAGEQLYEQSIQWSHENDFVQDEGLANERAAHFYRQRELLTTADGHLRNARSCYLRWGATAKVRELERRNRWLAGEASLATGADGTGIGTMDAIAVIRATQAISGEIRLDRLLNTLMTIVLEQAGAQKAILLLVRDDQVQLAAEAQIAENGILVQGHEGAPYEGSLPLSVVNYVRRTKERVITDTANRQMIFAADPYFSSSSALSMLCLPLLRQSDLIGLLYLENDLVRGAFTPERVMLLEILAAQAAISLENAVLYSEQRRSEIAIRESEQRFRAIIENLQDVYYSTDAEGRLTMISPSGVRLLGYASQDEMIGFLVRDTFYYRPEERDTFVRNLKMKGQLYHYEVTLRRRDGSPVPVATSTRLVFDADGTFTGVEGTFRDISEVKAAADERLKLEQQLLHAQKLESLGVLAGGIAHDFNNILMAIMGNADLALMRISPESPAADNLHRIEQASARAADLARQMLAYSGKGKFVVENINLNKLLEDMLHMLDVSISKKAVLRLNLQRPLPPVEADSAQMQQIIMNLVINASEAIGDRSGVISITTGCMECDKGYLKDVWLDENIAEGLYVYFEIADSGCGMDEEVLAKIFDPFFTTKFTGRGLGMAAVLGIVRGHKGAIKVYSEAGKGSSFKILLPASERPAEMPDSNGRVDAWQGIGKVLLVDDEDAVRGIGAEMLTELGFEVLTASDGREAVEIFRRVPDISFVILDLTMPHMDGEQCFRELRVLKPDVRVIISSGYNEQEVTQRFVGKGLAGFIQKPYRMSVLREELKKLEGRP